VKSTESNSIEFLKGMTLNHRSRFLRLVIQRRHILDRLSYDVSGVCL
jgi:hypothetical protein